MLLGAANPTEVYFFSILNEVLQARINFRQQTRQIFSSETTNVQVLWVILPDTILTGLPNRAIGVDCCPTLTHHKGVSQGALREKGQALVLLVVHPHTTPIKGDPAGLGDDFL